MLFSNKTILLIFAFILGFLALGSPAKSQDLVERATFFPENNRINQQNISWAYLQVPEDWDRPQGKKIQLAVAILKSTSEKPESPVLYIEGGPGGAGSSIIEPWLAHPIRKKRDIIFMDIRGTGFSVPRFCPDLSTQFLAIFARNQNGEKDKKQKLEAVLNCNQELLSRNIDLKNYNSLSVAKDLHALKKALGLQQWNVYSVSYGTYIAQVYAAAFVQDLSTLILDSGISDITQFYNYNTSNFITSLEEVFAQCKSAPDCNRNYPNLATTFYQTLDKLRVEPITIKVDKTLVPTGEFTYNAEDFKIIIQQALYQKTLIEILPLLITSFSEEKKDELSNLVNAFIGALDLDYGVYYAMTCNEAIPFNTYDEYLADAAKHKLLKEGLSFYATDFQICKQWSPQKINDQPQSIDSAASQELPTLIFAGGLDPITPPSNGEDLHKRYVNSHLVKAPNYGHAASFTLTGANIITEFIADNGKAPSTQFKASKINFAPTITSDKRIYKMAKSVENFDLLFFSPIIIAHLVLLLFFGVKLRSLILRNSTSKLVDTFIVINSFLGMLIIPAFFYAIANTAAQNPSILIFGLPEQYILLNYLPTLFIGLSLCLFLLLLLAIRSKQDKLTLFTVLFSNVLLLTYLFR